MATGKSPKKRQNSDQTPQNLDLTQESLSAEADFEDRSTGSGSLKAVADPTNLSVARVLYLQRTIGNQASLRMIERHRQHKAASAPNVSRVTTPSTQVQRAGDLGDKGLLQLDAGVEGEVGLPGSVDKGAKLYPPNTLKNKNAAPIHTFAAKTNVLLHDIGDKKYLYAQVPALQLTNPTAEISKKKSKKEIEDAKKTNTPVGAGLKGLVTKAKANRGGLRHKAVKGEIFAKEPSPEDVLQGGLGDCYFLAALSSVAATQPAKIKSMITDLKDGTVSVRFYKVTKPPQGEKTFTAQYVTIRKTVAMTMGGGRLFTEGKTIWPALVEKAYAAWDSHSPEALPSGFKGTYEGIAGGFSSDSWEQILGVPAVKGDIKKNPTEQEWATPWNDKIVATSAGDAYVIKPDDSLASIALAHGITAKELRDYCVEQLSKPELRKFGGHKKAEFFTAIGDDAKIAGFNFTSPTDSKKVNPPQTMNIPTTNDKELLKLIPDMPDTDRQKWISHLQSVGNVSNLVTAHQEITKDADASDKTTGVTGLSFVEKLATDAKLSPKGRQELLKYCAGFLEGTPDKPETYSGAAKALFVQVRDGLAAGKFVGLGSMNWGEGEGNAGENTDKVAGIVGGHAFSVLDTVPSFKLPDKNIDGKPLYLIIRNPWGRFGRKYDENFKAYETEEGQYQLEITDVRKYFLNVYYTEKSVEEMMVPRKG